MTYPGQFPGWDPFRTLDSLAALWSTAATASVANGPAGVYQTLFTTLRRLVIGRTLTVGLSAGEVSLTITDLDSGLDVRSLSVGQLNDVALSAKEISWNGRQFDRATAVMHNVHIKPATPPVIVAAPVDLSVDVPAGVIEELVGQAAPRLVGQIGADSIARVRWARLPALGHLEVDTWVEGSTLAFRPRVLSLRRARWKLPDRTPAYRVRLPQLPYGLELTGISMGSRTVRLSGRLSEWSAAVPGGRLEDALNQLSGVGRSLNLTLFKRARGD